MGTPVRFPTGVSTAAPQDVLAAFPLLDPFNTGTVSGLGVASYATDFMTLLASTTEFTVTGTSSTFALVAAGVGGTAILTPGGATTASSAYKTTQGFQFVSGQKAWFATRFKCSAVAGNVVFNVGLQAGSSTDDGLYLTKAAATTTVKLVSSVGNTDTDLIASVGTAVANTYSTVGFYYDGTDLIVYYNGVKAGRVTAPTIGASATTLTNVALGPVFQITPTSTDTMTIDYVLAAAEVSR